MKNHLCIFNLFWVLLLVTHFRWFSVSGPALREGGPKTENWGRTKNDHKSTKRLTELGAKYTCVSKTALLYFSKMPSPTTSPRLRSRRWSCHLSIASHLLIRSNVKHAACSQLILLHNLLFRFGINYTSFWLIILLWYFDFQWSLRWKYFSFPVLCVWSHFHCWV